MRPVTAFDANRKTRAEYQSRHDEEKSSSTIEAEKAFAADLYRDRAEINRIAQTVLVSGSRQITIRLRNDEIALARRQAEAKGLKYQTYIKMLLHEALVRNPAAR